LLIICFSRRLLFLSRPNLTQSEALLKPLKEKNKKKGQQRWVVDLSVLTSTYHSLMVGGLGLYLSQPITILLVGLGGGSLPAYIHR
jgi:hypothetical protein